MTLIGWAEITILRMKFTRWKEITLFHVLYHEHILNIILFKILQYYTVILQSQQLQSIWKWVTYWKRTLNQYIILKLITFLLSIYKAMNTPSGSSCVDTSVDAAVFKYFVTLENRTRPIPKHQNFKAAAGITTRITKSKFARYDIKTNYIKISWATICVNFNLYWNPVVQRERMNCKEQWSHKK